MVRKGTWRVDQMQHGNYIKKIVPGEARRACCLEEGMPRGCWEVAAGRWE
jgi:hypothetical protein